MITINNENQLCSILLLRKVTEIHQCALREEDKVGCANQNKEPSLVCVEDAGEFGEDIGAKQTTLWRDHKVFETHVSVDDAEHA